MFLRVVRAPGGKRSHRQTAVAWSGRPRLGAHVRLSDIAEFTCLSIAITRGASPKHDGGPPKRRGCRPTKYLNRLKQGVLDWNKWRLDNPTVDLDLSGTNLAAAGLSESDFVGHGSCSPTTAR